MYKPNDLPKTNKLFEPNYETGDCTIHHACSIHYAEPVTIHSDKRSVVVRLSFFGVNNLIKMVILIGIKNASS